MLAVHWTPVNKTKHILRNGLTKSKNGLYCFPLTGHKSLDKWWVQFFNQCAVRHRKNYNGIVFRISEEDLPAYFGHWIGATSKDVFDKPINNLEELGREFRETIIWRIGEFVSKSKGIQRYDSWKDFEKHGINELKQNPKTFIDHYNDEGFMNYTFEDYQIVLSNSIPAKRILKILPQGDEFGRTNYKNKLNKNDR